MFHSSSLRSLLVASTCYVEGVAQQGSTSLEAVRQQMSTILPGMASTLLVRPSGRPLIRLPSRFHPPASRRLIFPLFRKKLQEKAPEPTPTLSEDNLFHPFSKSPFPAIRARGDAIQSIAPCPVCSSDHTIDHASPRAVKFECPDCGWPTHCTEGHWKADADHRKYCSRLREVNEDEHDLRSGRRLREFELPGRFFFIRLRRF
jgi:mitochondrial splicing suppressor protein 51